MSIRVLFSLAALVLAAGPLGAQQSAAPAQQEVKPVKQKKVCRPIQSTGTIMAKTRCLTKEQWALQDEASDRAKDRRSNER